MSRGNAQFQPRPIQVSTWVDQDSYQWVRVDDYGMGMNEDIITRFLLKVGESYYQSAQFRADVLNYRQQGQPEFVPISRFGIGVLSCFIASDRVEVTTRYVGDGKSDPHSVRLHLSGLHSFYVLQSEKDELCIPAPMPGPRHDAAQQAGYRRGRHYGTSVAVRLDPQKENAKLDLKALLERYAFCSPIPVIFEGERIGGDPAETIEKPSLDRIVEMPLGDEEMKRIEEVFGMNFSEKIKVRLIPLDLIKHSPTPDLKGQALLAYLWIPKGEREKIDELQNYKDSNNAARALAADRAFGVCDPVPSGQYIFVDGLSERRSEITLIRSWGQAFAPVRSGRISGDGMKPT